MDEKQEMVASLESGQQELLEAQSGLSEGEARRSPAPDRWSVLECVEHVAVVEDYLFEQILASQAVEVPVVNPQREKRISLRGMDRGFKIEAPDFARPAGRFPSLAAATQRFVESRARTIRYVEDCSVDLRSRLTTHPLIGTVNCWENLLLMAMHPRRHAAQIREIRKEVAAERHLIP